MGKDVKRKEMLLLSVTFVVLQDSAYLLSVTFVVLQDPDGRHIAIWCNVY